MPTQTSGGAQTYFARSGHGTEPGLFLHCALAQGSAWDRVTALLADEMSMIAMDLPGHGRSEDWDTARDFAEQARDMAYGLLSGPMHVIGHSFGGYVALRLALDHPEKVRSLTLIDPIFFAAARHADETRFRDHLRRAQRYMEALAEGDPVSAAREFTADWGVGLPWESLNPEHAAYISDRMSLIAATEAAVLDDNGAVWDRLEQIECPILMTGGSASPPVMHAILDGLQSKQPLAKRVRLEGAGHMAPITHPDKVSALIGSFVRS